VKLRIGQEHRGVSADSALGIAGASMPLISRISVETADVISSETHGFRAAPKAAVAEYGASTITAQVAARAIVQFGLAANEVWKRQIVRLLSIAGFSPTA
jgi:hypothetical protein